MGILLVYDVTDERSFNSMLLLTHLSSFLLIMFRYPDVARQYRATCFRRREQDSYWEQVGLG